MEKFAVEEWILAIITGVVGILTWLGQRQIARIDQLETNQETFVKKNDFDTFRRELREDHHQVQTEINRAVETLTQAMGRSRQEDRAAINDIRMQLNTITQALLERRNGTP